MSPLAGAVAALLILLLLGQMAPARADVVALALSGGGARGFAAIGILEALEEEGLEPDLIVGTSMGAVLGGLYAAGYTASELRGIALHSDWSSLFLDRPSRRSLFLGQKEASAMHILSLRFRGFVPELPIAITHGQKLNELLFDLVHRAPYQPWPSFDDLRIPFRAVATDLISGQPVVFKSGDLAEAMRASISLPLVFAPFVIDTMVLTDGGVVENIPVDIARQEGADAVIAVDMAAGLAAAEDLALPWELANRVTTIMHLERNNQSRTAASLVLAPDVGRHRASEFANIDSLIDAGYRCAKAHMPALKAIYARSDTTLPRPWGQSYIARDRFRRFERQAAAPLPPRAYAFRGVDAIPDSIVSRLPAGSDGLVKLELLRRSYMDRGQVLAHATDLELQSDGTLYSRWEEGRIRSIRVAGLTRYRPGLVLREFPLRPGDRFDLRRAKRGLNQIYGSHLYEWVTLSVLPTDSGAHLTLRAQERQSPQLRLGAGFSLERKGRGFAEFLNDNLLNSGARLALFGKYGEMDEALRASVTFDRFPINTALDQALQSYLTTDLHVGWRREEYDFFDTRHNPVGFYFFERTGGEFWLGRAFRRWSEVSGGLRHESIRVGGVLDEPTATVTTVAVRGVIDTQDRYPFPTSGVAFNGSYEFALRSHSGGRSFNRLRGLGDAYLPLHRRIVLHGRGDYAWNDRILPLWGQFPLGGEESLLGLHVAERMGNCKLGLLGEVRWDLLSRWMADAFVSGIYTVGAVTPESRPFPKSEHYEHGFGASLGLSTFLGPISVTVGHLLESHHSQAITHAYINLGHRF